VEPNEDREFDQSGPEPDDETEAGDGIEESENEEVSSASTKAPPPAKPARPKAPARPPKSAPKPAPAPRTKTPPAAAEAAAASPAPARTKSPPPAARPKPTDTNGSMDATYRKSAGLMKLISDPTRLAIVDILRAGELHVTDLCERLNLKSQPAVSHHLALLRHGRIIEPRRTGKHNFYSLTEEYGNVLADLVEEITAS
jgi:ArsR family transcriptional regulator, zinc-responsive transcriptional repressor